MNFNRKEHSRFIRCLDGAAEKNPLLWLPCVALIALALAAEHIAGRAERRNAERAVNNAPQLERKPFFLRAVAVTLTLAFTFMLVPTVSFDAFGEEYDPAEEQVVFDETSETEDTSDLEEISEPAVTTVPEETADPDVTTTPDETTDPDETTTPEETTDPDVTTDPDETTAPEETTDPEEHEHTFGGVMTDEDGHYWICTECNYKSSFPHRFETDWVSGDEGHWHKCVYCDAVTDVEEHEYEWFSYASYHCRVCVCDKEVDVGEHFIDRWEHNAKRHWGKCICGESLPAEDHSFSEYVFTVGEDGETSVKRYYCTSYCGYYYDEPITHTHTVSGKLEYNADGHWGECTCGEKLPAEAHSFSGYVDTVGEDGKTSVKRYYCTSNCGYYYDEPIDHTHKPGTVWKNDGSEHWHECTSCGEKTDTAKHDYVITVAVQPVGTSAGTRVYTCTVCGYSYEEVIPAAEQIPVPVTVTAQNTGYTERLPYITDAAEVGGWTNIAAYINASPDGVTVPITMNGETDLPKDILKCIMYRDIALRIKMDGYSVWTVNGLNVTDPQTVSLRVAEKSDKIPAGLIGGLISELEPKEYKLYHGGDFGFKAALTLNVSKKYNNYYAELYHYNTKTGQLEFVDESFVKNRLVTFDITHASYYAVAFSSIPIYDDVSSGAGIFENSVPIETSAMPETGGVTIPAVKLPQIMRYSGKRRRYRILKKRRLDDLVFVL